MSQPFESPRPATIRSKLMLEAVSEMVSQRGYPYSQAKVSLRPQGPGPWAFALIGSDAPEAIDQVAKREVDVAIINPSTVLNIAYLGKGPYKGPIPVRTIGVIPSRDWFGFAVKESTGLTSVGDIGRKHFPLRVSLREQRDHSVHLVLEQVLQEHGFSLSDITEWGGQVSYDPGLPADPARIGRAESGEVDAIFDEAVSRFIPPAVKLGMRFLPIDKEAAPKLVDIGLRPDMLPKSKFPMLPADVQMSALLNVVVPDLARAIRIAAVARTQLLDFAVGERKQIAEHAGVEGAARRFLQVQAVHKELFHAGRGHDGAVSPQ